MYPARITAVSLFAIGIVTLVAAALPDQAEAPETAIPVPVYSLAPSTTVQVLEPAEEVVAVSEEITPLYSDEDVATIAKTVYRRCHPDGSCGLHPAGCQAVPGRERGGPGEELDPSAGPGR